MRTGARQVRFGEIEKPDDVETLFHCKPLVERYLRGGRASDADSPLDEYPIHQLPQPIAWVGSSDRNFYDRCYFNAHDRSGDIFLITGLGYYPNLGTKDAFVLVRRGDEQTAMHLGDALDHDRLNQRVGNYRLEVVEPLQELRIVLEETEGIAMDLHWRGLFPVVQEQPHLMRAGGLRPTLDAQRFAQLGSWEGSLVIDGEERVVDPATWIGSRDRSWGIRPVGEAEPPGRPADPPFDGMWWLYLPIAFPDFAIVPDRAGGAGRLPGPQRRDPGLARRPGRAARLAAGADQLRLGHPDAEERRGHLHHSRRHPGDDRGRVAARRTDRVGGGYGGDPDWGHGQWKGAGFAERVTYDMNDPAVVGRVPFGLTDSVGRAVWREEGQEPVEGWGLYEHGVIGKHEPTGFTDWFIHAP